MDGWTDEADEIQMFLTINSTILIACSIASLLVGKYLEPIFYKFAVSTF